MDDGEIVAGLQRFVDELEEIAAALKQQRGIAQEDEAPRLTVVKGGDDNSDA